MFFFADINILLRLFMIIAPLLPTNTPVHLALFFKSFEFSTIIRVFSHHKILEVCAFIAVLQVLIPT